MSSILDKCAEDEENHSNAFGYNIFKKCVRKPTSIIKDVLVMYVQAILAGMLIGLAGAMYLAVENQIVGALLFSFGLLSIIALDLPLFTGKIGYLFHDDDITPSKLFIMLFGNLVGTNIISYMMIPTRFWRKIDVRVDDMVITTISGTWYSTLLAAIGCGIFMYIAVEGNKVYNKDVRGSIITIFSVMGFILTGCLHSIANMFYIYVCRSVEFIQIASMDYRPMTWIAIMVIGNALGSQLASLLHCKKKKEPILFG